MTDGDGHKLRMMSLDVSPWRLAGLCKYQSTILVHVTYVYLYVHRYLPEGGVGGVGGLPFKLPY